MGTLNDNRVTVQTDRATVRLTRLGANAKAKFYSGSPIADASMSPTGTLLATLPASAVFGVVSAGVSNGAVAKLTANPFTQQNGVANGTPGYCILTDSSDVGVSVLDVGATGSGAAVIMTPNTITSGAPVSISSMVISEA